MAYLTTKQYGERIGCSASAIRQACERGRIQGDIVKIPGGHGIWMIHDSAIYSQRPKGRRVGSYGAKRRAEEDGFDLLG